MSKQVLFIGSNSTVQLEYDFYLFTYCAVFDSSTVPTIHITADMVLFDTTRANQQ